MHPSISIDDEGEYRLVTWFPSPDEDDLEEPTGRTVERSALELVNELTLQGWTLHSVSRHRAQEDADSAMTWVSRSYNLLPVRPDPERPTLFRGADDDPDGGPR